VCGVGRAGRAESSNSARRGAMWSQGVCFQIRRKGGGFKSGVESTIERAVLSEPVGGREGFNEEN